MKHTPGPWKVDLGYDDHDKGSEVWSESKDTFLQEPVCIIPHDDVIEGGDLEMKANARLIVAAPDLLDACHLASHAFRPFAAADLSNGAVIDEMEAARKRLDAVIKKVEGDEKGTT